MVCRKFVDNSLTRPANSYSSDVKWENFFEGFESLWDAEDASSEFDERRELIRADRALKSFSELLLDRSETTSHAIMTDASSQALHPVRLGAGWIDTVGCESGGRVIVPLGAVALAGSFPHCDCATRELHHLAHVTFGAALRDIERRALPVRVVTARGGVNGRVIAVWRDAFDVGTPRTHISILNSRVDHIVVDGS